MTKDYEDYEADPPEITVRVRGAQTIALAQAGQSEPNRTIGIGIARCSPKDDFDTDIGSTLAIGRALQDLGRRVEKETLAESDRRTVEKERTNRKSKRHHETGKIRREIRERLRDRLIELAEGRENLQPDAVSPCGHTFLDHAVDAYLGEHGEEGYKILCAALGDEFMDSIVMMEWNALLDSILSNFMAKDSGQGWSDHTDDPREDRMACGHTKVEHEAKVESVPDLLNKIFGDRATVINLADPETEVSDDVVPAEMRDFVNGLIARSDVEGAYLVKPDFAPKTDKPRSREEVKEKMAQVKVDTEGVRLPAAAEVETNDENLSGTSGEDGPAPRGLGRFHNR